MKKFLITSIIILILKIVGGIFLHSHALLASSIFELFLIINCLLTTSKKDNSLKKVVSIIYSLIIIAALVLLNYLSITNENNNPSLLLILILVISLFIRYIVSVLGVNKSLQQRKGTLAFQTISSSQDFLLFIIPLVSIILNKVGKWISVLHYADKVGCLIISLILLIKVFKIIINTFNTKTDFINEYTNEINNHKEVKSIKNLNMTSFGGVRKLTISITPKDNITIIDLSSFIVNLQDYLLKKANVAEIVFSEENSFRKVMENARNSGSRNSKTNSSKKNTKKKNKKR